MDYKRVLTVQDISCVGQCSLTVALPILSACGLETAVLPSAVLSTHTAGFTGYTFRDLTEDMPAILAHWEKEGIRFSAVYTGYLGSARQIGYVREIMDKTLSEGGVRIVDPVMADNGALYPGFDREFVEEMKPLAFTADVILPNLTEACLLTGLPYREEYNESYIRCVTQALHAAGARTVVLTGVGYTPDTTGVVVSENGEMQYYRQTRLPQTCHGTGDVFASVFTGAYVSGKSAYAAAAAAADFTAACIQNTAGDAQHWYGVKFEPLLPLLAEKVRGETDVEKSI